MSALEDKWVGYYEALGYDLKNSHRLGDIAAQQEADKIAKDAADKAKADASAAASKAAVSTFLSGFSGYSSLADKDISAADALSLVTASESIKANELALTTQSRAIFGNTLGDTNNSSVPGPAGAAGATPAPIVATTSPRTSALYIVIALIVGWIFLRKK